MFQIQFSRFLDLNYWLDGVAGDTALRTTEVIAKDSTNFWFVLYFFSFVFIAGITLRVSLAFLHDQNPFQLKFPGWSNNLIAFGLLGLFWFLSRQTSIKLLGSRLWLIAFLIWALFLFYGVTKYFISFFPLEMRYFKQTYFPKSKKD